MVWRTNVTRRIFDSWDTCNFNLFRFALRSILTVWPEVPSANVIQLSKALTLYLAPYVPLVINAIPTLMPDLYRVAKFGITTESRCLAAGAWNVATDIKQQMARAIKRISRVSLPSLIAFPPTKTNKHWDSLSSYVISWILNRLRCLEEPFFNS